MGRWWPTAKPTYFSPIVRVLSPPNARTLVNRLCSCRTSSPSALTMVSPSCSPLRPSPTALQCSFSPMGNAFLPSMAFRLPIFPCRPRDGSSMLLHRRAFVALLGALAAPRLAWAATTLTDAAGRPVQVPEQVTRVFPSGPPAAILLYTLAPELLIGWPRANSAEERGFLLPDVGARPEVGRLTGRGNTANLETVIALKPDVILDVGYIDPTYVSLADRVQQQTGIPYALLDGHFDKTAATYRTLGELTGRREEAAKLAGYAEDTLT